MKTRFSLIFSLLALYSFPAFSSSPVLGRVTISLRPVYGRGGWREVDLRQEGDKILGQSSTGRGMISFRVDKSGLYAGPTGSGLTHLQCSQSSCDGFINSKAASFKTMTKTKNNESYLSTSGTLNNGQLYEADLYSDGRLTISGWNSLELKKLKDGQYRGNAQIGVMNTYDASLDADGTLTHFVDDPGLVAIFLGELITR